MAFGGIWSKTKTKASKNKTKTTPPNKKQAIGQQQQLKNKNNRLNKSKKTNNYNNNPINNNQNKKMNNNQSTTTLKTTTGKTNNSFLHVRYTFLTAKTRMCPISFCFHRKQELVFVAQKQNPDSCRKIVVSEFFVWFCLSCETTVCTIFAQLATPPKNGHKNVFFKNPESFRKIVVWELQKYSLLFKMQFLW